MNIINSIYYALVSQLMVSHNIEAKTIDAGDR